MTRQRSAAIVALTIFFGFAINAIGHLFLIWRGDPLVREFRGTLQFASAWIGDCLILPILNVVTARQVLASGFRRQDLVRSVALGAAATTGMHVLQATGGHVNWTMPVPWRWTALGWYHVAFMWTQLSWLFLALHSSLRARNTQAGRLTLAAIALGMAAFALVLQWDYEPGKTPRP